MLRAMRQSAASIPGWHENSRRRPSATAAACSAPDSPAAKLTSRLNTNSRMLTITAPSSTLRTNSQPRAKRRASASNNPAAAAFTAA